MKKKLSKSQSPSKSPSKSRAVSVLPDADSFDLLERVRDLQEAEYSLEEMGEKRTSDKVITLRNVPTFLKDCMSDFQLWATRLPKDPIKPEHGITYSVCLAHGMERLKSCKEVQTFIDLARNTQLNSYDLDFARRGRLLKIVKSFDFSVIDIHDSGSEQLCFKCPTEIHSRLYENLTLLRLERCLSQFAIPCIMLGFVDQPSIHPQASESMLDNFNRLRESFADRAEEGKGIVESFGVKLPEIDHE